MNNEINELILEKPIMKLLSKNHGISVSEINKLINLVYDLIREENISFRYGEIAMTCFDRLDTQKKISLLLNLINEDDIRCLMESDSQESLKKIRQNRLKRITAQVDLAGAAISLNELALILGVSRRTIQRDVAVLREKGDRISLSRNHS